MTIEERSAPDADARIAGNERAWVDALGPAATSDELVISGDEHLAESLLSALSSIAGRAAVVA